MVKVSRVSILSPFLLAMWMQYRQYLLMAEVVQATNGDPEMLVQFVAAMLSALEED